MGLLKLIRFFHVLIAVFQSIHKIVLQQAHVPSSHTYLISDFTRDLHI